MISEANLLSKILFHYPNAEAILLTGSNVKKSEFDGDSDIDILIIDKQFSHVTPLIIMENEYKFDVTQIPLNNIENILINEKFDPRGTLLSMISNSRIIKESSNQIASLIITEAQKIYQVKSIKVNKLKKQHFERLLKLRIEFEKKLSFEKKFLLLIDFVNTISQIEAINQTNWLQLGKYRANLLIEQSPDFLNNLIAITRQQLIEGCDTNDIVNFIDLYLLDQTNSKETLTVDRFIADIRYRSINMQNFVETVLPAIYNHQLLGEIFLYFFISQKNSHQIYANAISLVFKLDKNNNSYSSKSIYLALKKICHDVLPIQISGVPSWLYTEESKIRQLYYDFESCAKKINQIEEKNIHDFKIHDAERTVYIAIIVLAFTAQRLDLSISELVEINEYLLHRSLISSSEQLKIKNPRDLIKLTNIKLKLLKEYFHPNQELILNALKKGIGYDITDPENQKKEYHNLIVELKILIAQQLEKIDSHRENFKITYEILTECYNLVNSDKGLIYVLIHSELSRLFVLSDEQLSLCLITINESIYQLNQTSPLDKMQKFELY